MSLQIESEVKLDSEPCVLTCSEDVYVGTEDGFIRAFDSSLKQKASWQAHSVQPFALEAGGGRVYSSSNDGGVRVWSPTGEKLRELPNLSGADIGTLRLYEGALYTGDESGLVMVFEKDELQAQYTVMEEVKDIVVDRPYMFTVRDLDITVTEIKPDTSKCQFITRHTMQGRAPIKRAGSLLIMVSRDGKCLRLHDNSIESKFKLLQEVQASEMILTSIAVSGDSDVAWTAGWDGRLRGWKIDRTQAKLTPAGDLELGGCITGLACPKEPNVVFAAVSGGKLVCVRA